MNVHEAKTHFSRLLERVEAGEEVVIARNGKPVARLVPLERRQRQSGRAKGLIRIGKDFDAPLPDEEARALRGEAE